MALWPAVVGGVALATVAGFAVAVLPGGLGVREGVLMTTLSPTLGADTAVIAALALPSDVGHRRARRRRGLSLVRPPLPLAPAILVPDGSTS